MGNCIDLMLSSPQKKVRVLVFDGGEEEFKASTTVEKITSGPYLGYKLVHHIQPHLPLPPDAKLRSSEVYYLIPHFREHCRHLISQKKVNNGSRQGRKVKIVLTKQQLELLLRSRKKFQSKQIAHQLFLEGGRSKK